MIEVCIKRLFTNVWNARESFLRGRRHTHSNEAGNNNNRKKIKIGIVPLFHEFASAYSVKAVS